MCMMRVVWPVGKKKTDFQRKGAFMRLQRGYVYACTYKRLTGFWGGRGPIFEGKVAFMLVLWVQNGLGAEEDPFPGAKVRPYVDKRVHLGMSDGLSG